MTSDHLSRVFAALADPTRRAILARLSEGEVAVTELARPFQMSMPAVSKHLKVLESAGLISRSREAQWRPCRIDASPLREVHSWVEEYKRFWEESLDRLGVYLEQLATEKVSIEGPSKKPLAQEQFTRERISRGRPETKETLKKEKKNDPKKHR